MITIDCSNLIAEMEKKGITARDIANLLGKPQEVILTRMKGCTQWMYEEVIIIRNSMFPEYDLGYLFQPENVREAGQ